MVEALDKLEAGHLAFEDQECLGERTGRAPTYARKIDKAEAAIDFSRPAEEVARRINAFSPFPGAWTEMPLGDKRERVKVLRAGAETGSGAPGTILDDRLLVACTSGAVRLLELQRAGGKPMAAGDLLRGTPVAPGTSLGAASDDA